MRLSDLKESKEISLSKKALASLSVSARRLLEDWQFSDFGEKSKLIRAFKENNEYAQEIKNAFEPIKQYLKRREGETMTLYRGVLGDFDWDKEKYLSSWSSNPKDAEIFSGHRATSGKSLTPSFITDDQVSKAIEQFKRTGFTKFLGHKYLKNSDEYYSTYKGKEFITDGDNDNIEDQLKREQKEYNEMISNRIKKGNVVSKEIPIDNIVWIFQLSNEFIVKKT